MNKAQRVTVATLLTVVVTMVAASARADEEADAFVQAAIEKYRGFKTYHDRMEMMYEIAGTDAEGEKIDHKHDYSRTFTFARPGKFAWDGKEARILGNGQTRWTYVTRNGEYIESPADPEEGMAADLKFSSVNIMLHPHPIGAVLLQSGKRLTDLFPAIQKLERIVSEERNGEPGKRVFGQIAAEQHSFDQPVPFNMWFRDSDGLLTEARVDAKALYQHLMERPSSSDDEEEEEGGEETKQKVSIEKAEIVMVFSDIVTDADIPDDQFTFTPAADDKKVTSFRSRRPDRSEQMALIGKPAPDFSGTGLDGEAVSLADLRGRVVLLDFWATWCGPCVAAIPHIQKISETYADKPVTVLGINRDGAEKGEKVKRFLEKKKITFRQFMDEEGDVAKTYKVTGIPCSVLIDTNGVIQDIHVGFGSGGEDTLMEGIDLLLAGKPIHTEQEISQMQEDSKAGEDESKEEEEDEPASATALRMEQINAHKLVAGARHHGQFSGHMTRPFDLNGDGKDEFVMPSWGNRISFLSSDGQKVERIRLKGIPERFSLTSYQPVVTADGVHWLASFTRWGTRGESRTSRVGYFSPAGDAIWTYSPEVAEGSNSEIKLAADDLDGDGEMECVLGIATYKRKMMGASSWTYASQRAYLAVLDMTGSLQSLRSAGTQIDGLWILREPNADNRKAIICITSERVALFEYNKSAEPALTEVAKPADAE